MHISGFSKAPRHISPPCTFLIELVFGFSIPGRLKSHLGVVKFRELVEICWGSAGMKSIAPHLAEGRVICEAHSRVDTFPICFRWLIREVWTSFGASWGSSGVSENFGELYEFPSFTLYMAATVISVFGYLSGMNGQTTGKVLIS